jgi:L-cysteine desulfidase
MGVGIPGIKERGLYMAAALGLVAGDPEKGLLILSDLKDEDVRMALELIKQKKVVVHIKDQLDRLYVETLLITDQGQVKVIIVDHHLNVVEIQKDHQQIYKQDINEQEKIFYGIQKFEIEEIMAFIKNVPLEQISFLEDGFDMNMVIAEEGLCLPNSIGKSISLMIQKGLIHEDMINWAQRLCAGAAEARMSGSRLPVMSVTGSGNHGITVFLTVAAVAQMNRVKKDTLMRALALSILITSYIKSYTGTLSAMCGCGTAAGVGASAGAAYVLGGSFVEIVGAMRNMVGSISGLICDGAKEGCAYKLALTAGWSVQSALLALHGSIINESDGIVVGGSTKMLRNLGYVCNPGMLSTNKAIVDIMTNKY